ncbi:pre-rRNA-processing protein ESF2-like isoform X1 [Populus nigra]|uniref:pre-rRNA-processing protein ESF2-like isoform X1 n=1 Tax=Populus nigra TaxID=3691 RepID=UPI002B27273D|nr:pre-rRNA-processing protein ESF2-like isoform X1 [Populus nigra]
MSEEHEDQEQVLFLEEGKKKKLKNEAEKAQKHGVRYISRVPPGMDHVKLFQLLNQDGEKKRSQFYYDHWNIKYLSKFKWDNLTDKIAYEKVIREQKLALEISAAKRERDFYLKKVDQSCALSSIEERMKKKQKAQQETNGFPTILTKKTNC